VPPIYHFSAHPKRAFDAFQRHADVTGNATSQAYLAFFHATGYCDVVPINQAKAQLYYTFAAHGGDKGAQMTLGFRYWTGIGIVENCASAVEWYEHAAEHGERDSFSLSVLIVNTFAVSHGKVFVWASRRQDASVNASSAV